MRTPEYGESWPYRVVGKGDGSWEVHRNGCAQRLTKMDCTTAHRVARDLAARRAHV